MTMRSTLSVLAAAVVAASLAACQQDTRAAAQTFSKEEVAQMQELLRGRDFTPGTVRLIKAEVRGTDPRNYRLVLPTFKQEQGRWVLVGSETIGKLPVTEVRRLASVRKLEYKEAFNAQAIIFQNAEQGGAPGGGSGGGGQGGCEQDHSTPAHGEDIAARVENILRNINQSKYLFLY